MSQSLAEKLRRQLSSKKTGKHATAIIVFGAITLVFVFFGLPGKNGGIGIGYVARVNNSLISMADFQTQEKQIADQMNSIFGGKNPFGAEQNQYKQQAIRQLVRFELAQQAAQKERILATDAEIRDYITKDIPVFQENGQFMKERYSNYLAYMHTSPGDFESKLRKEVTNLRLLRLFEAANVDNKLIADHTTELKSQKVNLQFLKIDRDALAASKKFPADVIRTNLAQEGFKKRVEDRFALMKPKMDQPEEVNAQHILIMAKAGDAASGDKALKVLKSVQSQVKGNNFAQLAQKFSEDPGSAKKGGDLGYFQRGRMDPEFEKAAFSAKAGEVVGPVKTEFGYHLIKVLDHRAAKEAQLKDNQDKIAQQVLAEDQLDKDLKTLQESLAANKYDEVAKFQKDWGLTWQETGFFDMSQDVVAKLPVEDSSFVASLSAQKPWVSEVLSSRGPERFVVKFKEAKTEKPGESAMAAADQMKRQKSFNFYDGFIRQFEKDSVIQVNQQVLQ